MKPPSPLLSKEALPYCSGCSHSRLHHLIAEILLEEGLANRAFGVCSGGCSADMFKYFSLPFIQAPPGQAAAVATGIKRTSPDRQVFIYQGEGDLASRGWNAFVNASLRGESLTVICLNNMVLAGSGGQMSATSLTGQITTTTRLGRSRSHSGNPVDLMGLISQMPNIALCARVGLHTPDLLSEARQTLLTAFKYQELGKGLSFVEVLGMCPPYWNLSPEHAQQRLNTIEAEHYPTLLKKGRLL